MKNFLRRVSGLVGRCAVGALFLGAVASAAEIEGLNLPERVILAGNGPELVLNGAGVRTQAVFSVYVAALYLPAKMDDSEKILSTNRASRLSLHTLRKLTADQITSSIATALHESLTPEQRAPLEARLRELNARLETLPELKKGTQIVIDYVPNLGTAIQVDGAEIGRFPGADFNHALLRCWIGERPRDIRLKKAMLGFPI